MGVAVGIDLAKQVHWVVARVPDGATVLNRKLDNTPTAIAELISELDALTVHGVVTVGIDVLGGIAGLITAMLTSADFRCVHVPGLAVNRARRATRGGENKSDPRDARVIADQVRMRDDLRVIDPPNDVDVDLRLLTGRRQELVCDQTRRANRMRDLLCSIHPGMERRLDMTAKSDLLLLSRWVTAREIRAAGRARIVAALRRSKVTAPRAQALVGKALAAAVEQDIVVTGEATTAELVRELVADALVARDRIKAIDKRLEGLLDAHPDGDLVRSLPGMGTTLTSEFLAEVSSIDRFPTGNALAAASGLAPVVQQSGKTHYLRRANSGNRGLKRVFYQSAFCAVGLDPTSKAFYTRKRSEGKTHHQAVIALARRRINVLHAILRTRQPYNAEHSAAAA
jgi:transposase